MMLLHTTYHGSIGGLSWAYAAATRLTISDCPESVLPRYGCAPQRLRGKVEGTSAAEEIVGSQQMAVQSAKWV